MATNSPPPDGCDIRPGLRAMGRRLQNARREARLTQNAVAAKLEVTPQTIRNWESGRHEPPQRLRRTIADLYGVTQADILGQDTAGQLASPTPNSRVDVNPGRMRLGRERAGFTQAEASDRSGISPSTVLRYENGHISPTKANLETLAALYGRPARWFMRQERPAGRRIQPTKTAGTSAAEALFEDDVTEAYCLAQPDLTNEAVRSIADFIRFLHDQELRRSE